MKITNIKWDTDGDVEALEALPEEVTLPADEFNREDYMEDGEFNEDAFLEDVSDWLSDTYDFVMMDFQWRVRMKLSSSDGTQLTVDELREAYSLLSRCCLRIEEIIREIISPATSSCISCRSLSGTCKIIKQISEISEKLDNLIHKKIIYPIFLAPVLPGLFHADIF